MAHSYDFVKGGSLRKHVAIARSILGRVFKKGEQVHHIDGDGHNNAHNNLVICPSMEYHKLLHTRQRALDACGDANYRKCFVCHKWDDPKNMKLVATQFRAYHAECRNKVRREERKKK